MRRMPLPSFCTTYYHCFAALAPEIFGQGPVEVFLLSPTSMPIANSGRYRHMVAGIFCVLCLLAGCTTSGTTAPSTQPASPVLETSMLVAGRSLLRDDASTLVRWPGHVGQSLQWTSSDPRVAIVGEGGMVAAMRPGTAFIIGTDGARRDSVQVTVTRGTISDSTIVVAHRAFGQLFPENTLTAIAGALNLGAGAVEVDVRFSRDGVPIIMHDATVDRTTNGTGPVAAFDLAALKTLDACAKAPGDWAPCRVPTVAEALAALGPEAFVLLDLKERPTEQSFRDLVAIVRASGRQRHVMFIAFEGRLLRAIRQIDRTYPLGHLSVSQIPTDSLLGFGRMASLPINTSLATPQSYLGELDLADIDLITWTITDPAMATRLHQHGIRRFIANSPLPDL